MRAENQMNAGAVRKLPQHRANPLHQRLNVQRVIVEMVDGAFRRPAVRLSIHAPPLFQAAQRRGVGIVRIQRQQHNFIERPCLAQPLHRFACQRMPVAHRGHRYRVDVRRHRLHQGLALPFRQCSNRRASADLRVLLCHRNRPSRRNQFCNRPPQQSQRPQGNDVWVEEKVQQERLDGLP